MGWIEKFRDVELTHTPLAVMAKGDGFRNYRPGLQQWLKCTKSSQCPHSRNLKCVTTVDPANTLSSLKHDSIRVKTTKCNTHCRTGNPSANNYSIRLIDD